MKFCSLLVLLSPLAAFAVGQKGYLYNTTFFGAEQVHVPTTNKDKHNNIATGKIWLGDESYPTSFITLLRSGEVVNDVTFGQNLDQFMEPMFAYPLEGEEPEENPLLNATDEILISNNPDFISFIPAGSNAPTPWAMFVHFESPRPAITYRVNVEVLDNCTLKVHSIEANDWSEWGGLWVPCAGSISNWGTHLGSEEYEPNARLLTLTLEEFMAVAEEESDQTLPSMMAFLRYFGYYSGVPEGSMERLNEVFNPYKYGHITELGVDEDGSTQLTKWYTLGRQSFEMSEMWPDGHVVFMSDDGTNCVFTAFVMDTPNDLSAGTLYAAKFHQVDDKNGGKFDITWVRLGNATQDYLLTLVDGLTFDMIFNTTDPSTPDSSDPVCPKGFTSVNTGGFGVECLVVHEGMETAAAFFETRRYAAYMGATTELSKFEGTAVVASAGKMYAAIAEIREGMENYGRKGEYNPKFDYGASNDIRLPYGKCGCVYEISMEMKDGWMQPTKWEGLICGNTDYGTSDLNQCNVNSLSSPDNIVYMGKAGSGINTLLIAEDTSSHQNDYLWAYDLNTGDMTRILTSVYGAEVTGVNYYEDKNGCSILTTSIQHPYMETDFEKVNDTDSTGLRGWMGYIGPIGKKSATAVVEKSDDDPK